MYKLILDTTLADCSAVLTDGEQCLASATETLNRGHAERLPAMVSEVLQAGGISAMDLDTVVAVTGPGTFAGVRVAISVAHGIAVATGCKKAGIGLHAVLAEQGLLKDKIEKKASGRFAVHVVARGGLSMRQIFDHSNGQATAVDAPTTARFEEWAMDTDQAIMAAALPGGDVDSLAEALSAPVTALSAEPTAMIAATQRHCGTLKALYMRPPDAARAKPVFKIADTQKVADT